MGDFLLRLRSPSAILTGNYENFTAFQELRSKVLLRGCHNFSRAQTTLQCDMNDQQRQNLNKIREDYIAQGVQEKNIDVQVIFSSVLSVRGKGEATIGSIMHIDFWLHGWFCSEGLGDYDNRIFFDEYSLLERNGIHLSRRVKGIFGSRLTSSVRWALKLKNLRDGVQNGNAHTVVTEEDASQIRATTNVS